MKFIFKLSAAIFLFISLISTVVIACTTFTVSNDNLVYMGGNEDSPPNTPSFLCLDKNGTYGVIYFATPWEQWELEMMSGINEMGLSFHSNWIETEKLKPNPNGKSWDEWPITQLMREASTVEEILAKVFTYNWGDAIDYQIHFADKSGDAVVIHPGIDGELTYTRKTYGDGFLVSTNCNIAKLIDKNQWSNCYSSDRYNTVVKMLSKEFTNNTIEVKFLASILNASHENNDETETLYSFIYDLQNLRIHLYYNRQFDIPYIIDVRKELADTEGFKKLSLKELISNKPHRCKGLRVLKPRKDL